MTPRILLVHGWLGSPADLAPLDSALAPLGEVVNLTLPGPEFAEAAMLAGIGATIDRAGQQPLILIGHSTGGSLLLTGITRRLTAGGLPNLRLLVLCNTPPRIDFAYTERWSAHTDGRALPLHDLGGLVGLINRLARQAPLALPAPVLLVQGEADELVPADADWQGRFTGPVRRLGIPGAGHHLFEGEGAGVAIDAIVRAVMDALARVQLPAALARLLPGLARYAAAWPDSTRHITSSPSGMRALGGDFHAAPLAPTEPSLANIEITTRCTLGCKACARTQLKLKSRFMSLETFRQVLVALPHAWRINLVGLGEPLLHPDVLDFIALAAGQDRHVGLVTNAMNLDADMARGLAGSGLSALTFSIDAVNPAVVEKVRQGSDIALIAANIRGFMAERLRQGANVGTAAFTALTGTTVGEFESIVDFVADLGLSALMLTDLNFASNQARSVHAGFTHEHVRVFRLGLKRAAARRLPVLSVWGLEEFALDERYLDYLMLGGEQLAARSPRHAHCLSPWQTIPVNVDGDLTLCDCQPTARIGNILNPLSRWWNGQAMQEQRRRMLGDQPPEACLVCPRF